jgi:phospholipase/carboxylesterase
MFNNKSTSMKFKTIILLMILMNLNLYSQQLQKGTLNYLVKQPVIKSEHSPVIFLLHGIGSNERDLFSLADQFSKNYLIISAQAPIPLGSDGFAWFHIDLSSGARVIDINDEEKSRQAIISFISEMQKKYSFDPGQVFLVGFSQGAIMSYSVGLTRPDLVKGIAIMSGRLLEEVKPFITSDKKLDQLKVFISHGVNDNVLDIQYARTAMKFLQSKNIQAEYHEYSEGHGINNLMMEDLIRWLER